ncbi:hypothetical protein [Roseospirillum parvum]|uniref:Uncharacterized protein n=1 Tax=Roseospirillum parvum TaxID=83401 RepID=A0A1G7XL81_9PROT|nr:hypothetical protein [Roseospirillum parvum]SDG84836.1 hypothetical protein SAMN05421742_10319 [Roseospirillum parvum]
MSQTPATTPLPECGQPPPTVTPDHERPEAERHWLVRPTTIRRLWWGSGIGLALLVLLDLTVHGHPHFGIDGTFGFYGWYGFISCVAMVLFAKGLGYALKRKDTYYDA